MKSFAILVALLISANLCLADQSGSEFWARLLIESEEAGREKLADTSKIDTSGIDPQSKAAKLKVLVDIPFMILVAFGNPGVSPEGKTELSMDMTITAPDGSKPLDEKGLQVLTGEVSSGAMISESTVVMTVEPEDPIGEYSVSVKLRDGVKGEVKELRGTFVATRYEDVEMQRLSSGEGFRGAVVLTDWDGSFMDCMADGVPQVPPLTNGVGRRGITIYPLVVFGGAATDARGESNVTYDIKISDATERSWNGQNRDPKDIVLMDEKGVMAWAGKMDKSKRLCLPSIIPNLLLRPSVLGGVYRVEVSLKDNISGKSLRLTKSMNVSENGPWGNPLDECRTWGEVPDWLASACATVLRTESFLKQLSEEAELGSGLARYILGYILFYESGVPSSRVRGMELMKSAAEAGFGPAMVRLATINIFGYDDEFPVNTSIGAKYAMKAVETLPATDPAWGKMMDRIGFCYNNGDGLPKDTVAAEKYYRLAAEAGIPLPSITLAPTMLTMRLKSGSRKG